MKKLILISCLLLVAAITIKAQEIFDATKGNDLAKVKALIEADPLYVQDEIVLREELSILEPFVGKTWISEEKAPDGQTTLHFLLKLEPIHNGNTIKRYLECKELNFQSDGFYYYDPDKKEIALLELGSNGNFSIGNIKKENGVILKYGFTIFSNSKLKFRNTMEVTSDGKLIDKWFSLENGEWKAGHSRVFRVQ